MEIMLLVDWENSAVLNHAVSVHTNCKNTNRKRGQVKARANVGQDELIHLRA